MTADTLLELIKKGEGKLKALRECQPESKEQAAANWEEISNIIYNFYTNLNTKKTLDAFLAELEKLAKEEVSPENSLGSSAGEAKNYSQEDKIRFTRAVECFRKFKNPPRPAAQGEGNKYNPGDARKKACEELCEGFETSNDQATPPSENTEETNNLLKSAADGNLEGVKEALDKGADINGTDNKGYTALHWTASKGLSDCVKYLLEKGADCNKQDSEGNTALHVAAKNGRTESVELLVTQADLTIKNNAQQTALTLAQLEKAHLDKNGKATENYDEIIDMLTRALGESPESGESPEPGGKGDAVPPINPSANPNSEQDQGKP